MDKTGAVKKIQDYIRDHISEPVSLYDLAQSCGLSPWYTSRVFKELTGKNPFDYIRAIRLSKAALRLRDEKTKVIDVALDFVFDSHEGFTRAFSRQFGLSPKEYKKHTPPVKLFIPYPVTGASRNNNFKKEKKMKETKKDGKTAAIFVQVVERPARKMIIKRGIKATGYFEYCEEVGCDIWGILVSIKDALYEPVGAWLPKGMIKKGTSQYAMGVEVPVTYKGQVPEGFEILDLKPCKMMIFQGPSFKDEEFEEAITDLWDLVKEYNPEIYGFKWADEDGPRFQMEPQGYRGYIEGRPVREIAA